MRAIDAMGVYASLGVLVGLLWWRVQASPSLWSALLWPLYVPALVAAPAIPSRQSRVDTAMEELSEALASWEGCPPATHDSLQGARRGLNALAERVEQLEQVLASSDLEELEQAVGTAERDARAVLDGRLRNLKALRTLRDEASAELEQGLAALAELGTRVHLARFTGAESERITAELAGLAAAVDGAHEIARLGRQRALSSRNP